MEEGFEAWRRRQRAWISAWGRVLTFSTSRKEDRVFTPGGGLGSEVVVDGVGDDAGVGGGGGGAKYEGEVGVCGEVDMGWSGAVTPGVAASLRSDSILSL